MKNGIRNVGGILNKNFSMDQAGWSLVRSIRWASIQDEDFDTNVRKKLRRELGRELDWDMYLLIN